MKYIIFSLPVLTTLFGVEMRSLPQAEDSAPINIILSVISKTKETLPSLRQEDIRVKINGVPQPIADFQPAINLPLHVAIVIDKSGSQERNLRFAKAAAHMLVASQILSDSDRVAAISFGDTASLEQDFTNNLEDLNRAIDRILLSRGPTALYDALWVTCEKVFANDIDETARRAIVLISDGEDTSSKIRWTLAVEKAIQSNVEINAIMTEGQFGANKSILSNIVEPTGGHLFFPRREADLRQVIREIEQAWRAQYLVRCVPSSIKPQEPHWKVEIELVSPELHKKQLSLHYRRKYLKRTPPSENTYGYTKDNPIKVGGGSIQGPSNERNYLALLRGPEGQAVHFRRIGSCCFYRLENGESGLLDMWEVTYSGLKKPVVLYMDEYRYERLRAPSGFTIVGFSLEPGERSARP